MIEALPQKEDIFPISPETLRALRVVLARIVKVNPETTHFRYDGPVGSVRLPEEGIPKNNVGSGQVWLGEEFPDLVVNIHAEVEVPGTPIDLGPFGLVRPDANATELDEINQGFVTTDNLLAKDRIIQLRYDNVQPERVAAREIGELEAQDLLETYGAMAEVHVQSR